MPPTVQGASHKESVGETAIHSRHAACEVAVEHPGRESYRYTAGDDDFQEELK